MRVLILGTSNSLIKDGWTSGFKQQLPSAHVENRSLGGGPGFQFGYLAGADFSKYDFVFFDSLPNDEAYEYETPGYSDINWWSEIQAQLLGTIAAQTQLIVLGFSLKRFLYAPSSAFKARRHMVEAIGGLFVDVGAVISEVGERIVGASNPLYEDHPAHPRSPISFALGVALAHELSALTRETPAELTPTFAENFQSKLPVTENATLVHFKNSHLEESFIQINAGDVLRCSDELPAVGFFVNAHETHCYATLLHQERTIVTMFLQYVIRSGKLLKIFVPLPQPVKFDQLRITSVPSEPVVAIKPRITTSRSKRENGSALLLGEILYWVGPKLRDNVGTKTLSDAITPKLISYIKEHLDQLAKA